MPIFDIRHLKNLFTPSVQSWDTVLSPDCPHPFLTTTTQKVFDQLYLYENLYQHAINQLFH